MADIKEKELVEIKDDMPQWKKTLAGIVNHSAVFLWVIFSYLLFNFISRNPDLLWGAALYLSVVGPATMYGILALIAGTVIMTYLNPWMRPSQYKNGSDHEKRSMVYYWIGTMLSIALVIFGAN